MWKSIVTFYKTQNLRHTLNYLTSSLLIKAVGLISIPIYTHYLSKEDIGVISSFYSVMGLCVVFVGLDLYNSLTRYFFKGEKELADQLSTLFTYTLISCGLFTLLTFVGINYFAALTKIPKSIIWFLPMMVFGNIFFNIVLKLNQLSGDSKKYLYLSFRTHIGTTLAIGSIFIFSGNFFWRILGEGLGVLLSLAVTIPKYIHRIQLKFDRKLFADSLSYALFRLPFTFSNVMIYQFDVFFINKYNSSGAAGIYSIMLGTATLVYLFINPFTTSSLPTYFEELKNNKPLNLIKADKLAMYLITICAGLLILFSQEVMHILVDKKFWEGIVFIPLLILAFVFDSLKILFSRPYEYTNKIGLLSVITFAGCALSLLLNYVIVNTNGPLYLLLAIKNLSVFASIALTLYLVNRFHIKAFFPSLKLFLYPIIILLALIAFTYCIQTYLSAYLQWPLKLSLLAVGVYFLWKNISSKTTTETAA